MGTDGEVVNLLARLGAADAQAMAEFLPAIYSELKRLAGHCLGRERRNHTLQATALVHEAYLRLIEQRTPWVNQQQFVRVAATLMRRILVDYGRSSKALKRGGGAERVLLEESTAVFDGRAADVLAIDEALTRLTALDSRQAYVVELRFFGGLSIEEIAAALGISTATVKREWSVAKSWLARELYRADDV